jgi:integrase
MARTVRDAALGSREARSRLKVRGKPYWRLIEPGLHLGYRRLAARPGTWCVRRYVGTQAYVVEAIKGVVADDYSDADDRTVLSYAEAQRRAQASKPQAAGPLTVAKGVEDYLRHIEDKPGTEDATWRANALIIPQLGDVKVDELTTERLRKWHADLAKRPQRVRTRRGEEQKFAELDDSDEGRRRRRSSANRVLTILRAALNFAWREGHVASDAAWRRVRPFRGADVARVRFLTVDECRRVVNACDPDFRLLVEAALLTGCRYSELTRLTAADFRAENGTGTIHIVQSKSGKPRHVIVTSEGVEFFKRVCAGKSGTDLLFRSRGGFPWSRAMQSGPMQEASDRARLKPRATFHALRHTWASLAVMNSVPLIIVARNLGHASTRMVEQHYGHLAPDYFAKVIEEQAPRFGFKVDRKVAQIG